LVANARAHESKSDPGAFVNPRDADDERRFRGSFSGYERNAFFERQGEQWTEVGYAMGLDFDEDGRAVAPIDMDGDGDLDLALLSLQSLRLLRNEAKARNWIRVTLAPKIGESHALGAVVRVTSGTQTTVDRVRLTAGFHTQVSTALHFGLADATQADVEVRWPSGTAQIFKGLAANQRYQLTEDGAAKAAALPAWPVASRPRAARFSLAAPVETAAGKSEALAPSGQPQVVNFWAPWCAACKREVPALAALAARGVSVTGVSVETKDKPSVAAFVRRHGLTYRNRFATDAVIESFFGVGGEMRLPATFVFGADGQLKRSFFHEVTTAEIDAALQVEGATARDAWILAQFELEAGRPERARRLLKPAVRLGATDPAALLEVARLYVRLGDVAQAEAIVQRGIARNGDDADLLLLQGELLARQGQMSDAEAAVDAALAQTPRHRDALVNKAMLLKARGDLDGAKARLKLALEVDPRAQGPKRLLAEIESPP
jgi:thioredoxin-like negative regulator of GroEL